MVIKVARGAVGSDRRAKADDDPEELTDEDDESGTSADGPEEN